MEPDTRDDSTRTRLRADRLELSFVAAALQRSTTSMRTWSPPGGAASSQGATLPGPLAQAWSRHTRRHRAIVDVWTCLTGSSEDPGADWRLLDAAERSRADGFRFPRDRRSYIVRHAFARRVLAGYLDADPAEVTIRRQANGKPALAGCTSLAFNLTHDDGFAVVAVSDGRAVGVDVERIRRIGDVDALADGTVASDELEQLRRTCVEERSLAFLTLWTRKEAVAKATGAGLSLPFDSLSVLSADEMGAGRPRAGDRDLSLAFAMIPGIPGFVGAVAAAGDQVEIRPMGSWPLDTAPDARMAS